MDYFKKLLDLLKLEREEDRQSYRKLTEASTVGARRIAGLCWYPIAIRDSEMSRGDYLTIEVERTSHQDLPHQLRSGSSAALFSNHNAQKDRIEGTISFVNGQRLKITLRADELPEWAKDGKLGIDLLFDDNSYDEMQSALKQASARLADSAEGHLIKILTGEKSPTFHPGPPAHPAVAPPTPTHPAAAHPAPPGPPAPPPVAHSASTRPTTALPVSNPRGPALNASQQAAVDKILAANELAIVHGPPGTGKTTTLIQAIKALVKQDHKQILVVAPSNTAVDLLSEKLSYEGLNTLRVGNPARVSQRLLSLTLDSKMAEHSRSRDIKKLKKQAADFRNMAHKYKRNFGPSERDQRKLLFDEARKIMKEVENTEQYIIDDIITKAQVITATLVGANHYTVRNLKYDTVVIDEAGQALEPASWIPVLKAKKLVLAGDHCQLSPTVKSFQAARNGLSRTLLEKCVALHPDSVVLLEEQYRMNEMIMDYSSAVFYQHKLRAHPSVADHRLFPEDWPLVFIDTAGCGFDERTEGTGISNPEEAAFLFRHLTQLVADLGTHYPAGPWQKRSRDAAIGAQSASPSRPASPAPTGFPTIAVISPYQQQIQLLKEQLAHSPALLPYADQISVNTIDSFQGQERDIVYLSMTRSNTEMNIGFLSDIRRMNVAMTRARKKLVVIGDSATLSALPYYSDFIEYAQRRNVYQSAWEFMNS